jgi:hypothetical protein
MKVRTMLPSLIRTAGSSVVVFQLAGVFLFALLCHGQTAPTASSSTTSSSPTTSCPASFGVYGPLGGGGGSSSTASAPVTVTQTNSAGGGGGGAGSGGAQPSPLESDIIPISNAKVSAFDVAAALQGKITGVTLVPVGPSQLMFTVDPSKAGKIQLIVPDEQIVMVTATLPAADGKSAPQTKAATFTLRIRDAGTIVPPLDPAPTTPGAPPAPFAITTTELPDAVIKLQYSVKLATNASDPTKVNWAAAGNFPTWLKMAADGTLSGQPSLDSRLRVEKIKHDIETLIHELHGLDVTPTVIPLPRGYGHACDIVTAIGHQIPDVVSLAVIDDSRILAGMAYRDEDVTTATQKLRKLVKDLALSSVPPSPHVDSVTMQLYYDRDAPSVAAAVTQAFPQLKVSAASNNTASAYSSTLILADPTGDPGSWDSRSPMTQARRMIAQLDQPKPQMTINAWSLQSSTEHKDDLRPLVPMARRFAAGYNDALERSVGRGWGYLNAQMAANPVGFLDQTFAAYLCDRPTMAVGNAAFELQGGGGCPKALDNTLGYSLGYTDLFDRESPDLVRMMLVMLAAKHPYDEAQSTLDAMEGELGGNCFTSTTVGIVGRNNGPLCKLSEPKYQSCQDADAGFYKMQRDQIESIPFDTDTADEGKILPALSQRVPPRYVGFACTRERLAQLLNVEMEKGHTTSYLGQFRAAVADFLFQNKMKVEYPDDFEPFLYPASAAKLDSVLTPIIEAFNEDMQALQQNLQLQLTAGVPKDKHMSYTSNGLITVSVVSGNQASVETQSLNYFPQNPTMKLEDFASALVSGASTTSTTTTPAPASALLGGSLSSVIGALAAYKAAQPQQVTAKVGSGLSMTVTPYALSSDSGAELNVGVTYNENGAATISADTTQPQLTDDLNSRVSEHSVQTLVRMDALKFFEISTMQSVIARQKAPYKLFDPIVELPLLDGLGVFPNWRRKPQVIYDQSVIFMQAAIVPTAADLGNGLIVNSDWVRKVDGKIARAYSNQSFSDMSMPYECKPDSNLNKSNAKSAKSASCAEVPKPILPAIMEYHKRMMRYFSGEYRPADLNSLKKSCFDAAGNGMNGPAANCMPSFEEIVSSLEAGEDSND